MPLKMSQQNTPDKRTKDNIAFIAYGFNALIEVPAFEPREAIFPTIPLLPVMVELNKPTTATIMSTVTKIDFIEMSSSKLMNSLKYG
jgi:hypothetical protein